tara:strand:+ start:447 stop:623 length:177 start_codon:yes stop_codon:yes gene_type:complete
MLVAVVEQIFVLQLVIQVEQLEALAVEVQELELRALPTEVLVEAVVVAVRVVAQEDLV